jgi:hypothetical protein
MVQHWAHTFPHTSMCSRVYVCTCHVHVHTHTWARVLKNFMCTREKILPEELLRCNLEVWDCCSYLIIKESLWLEWPPPLPGYCQGEWGLRLIAQSCVHASLCYPVPSCMETEQHLDNLKFPKETSLTQKGKSVIQLLLGEMRIILL